jgi:hypothetical protein
LESRVSELEATARGLVALTAAAISAVPPHAVIVWEANWQAALESLPGAVPNLPPDFVERALMSIFAILACEPASGFSRLPD